MRTIALLALMLSSSLAFYFLNTRNFETVSIRREKQVMIQEHGQTRWIVVYSTEDSLRSNGYGEGAKAADILPDVAVLRRALFPSGDAQPVLRWLW
jgi:hypothetical protein